jgi:zinc protease
MRGTTTHNRQQIQEEMVKLNAQIAVSGSADGASASVQTTMANLAPALKLAAEILRSPSFPDSEFEQVKKQRLAGIENRRTNPGSIASLSLERTLNPYPKDDVRYVPTLDEETAELSKVTLDDVKKFYAEFYGASHGEIAFVGQFDPAEARKIAGDLLGDWKTPGPFERITNSYQKIARVNVKYETPDKQDATFAAGLPMEMKDTDPDYVAMVVANYMFGGSITSHMEGRIRNKEGLSYGATSQFGAPTEGNAALFSARATSNPMNTPKVEASFMDELTKTLAGGFTADEVAEAKKAIRDQRVVGRSQDAQLVRVMLTREEYSRTLDWDTQMDAKIAALTAEQVSAAFRKHIDPSAISIVKAGDFKTAGVYQQ